MLKKYEVNTEVRTARSMARGIDHTGRVSWGPPALHMHRKARMSTARVTRHNNILCVVCYLHRACNQRNNFCYTRQNKTRHRQAIYIYIYIYIYIFLFLFSAMAMHNYARSVRFSRPVSSYNPLSILSCTVCVRQISTSFTADAVFNCIHPSIRRFSSVSLSLYSSIHCNVRYAMLVHSGDMSKVS